MPSACWCARGRFGFRAKPLLAMRRPRLLQLNQLQRQQLAWPSQALLHISLALRSKRVCLMWTHQDLGKLYLAVPERSASFLHDFFYHALGSNDIGLDRGQAGGSHLVHFERHGKRLF